MDFQSFFCLTLVLSGALIMLVSIVRVKELMKAMPYAKERHREDLRRYILMHRGLMIFFFMGYLFMLVAMARHLSFVGEIVLSLILFFGAIFVFIGILLQSRLLSEVQSTLQGILPICAKCKKIRLAGGKAEDPKAWRRIEDFFSERVDVDFTHGYCPECYQEEISYIEELEAMTDTTQERRRH
jgi:Ca2+/Na+ antiporter